MSIPRRSFDLDAYLLDRVAQPVVDRTGIDPHAWAARLFHVHGATYLGLISYAVFRAYGLPDPPPLFDAVFALATVLIQIAIMGAALRMPDALWASMIGTGFRYGQILTGAVSPVYLLVMVALKPDRSAVGKVGLVLLAVSLFLALVVAYLRSCRKPPPRRRKPQARRARQFA